MPVVQPKPRSGAGSRVGTPSLVPLTPRTSSGVLEPQNESVAKTSMASFPELMPPMQSVSTANMQSPHTTNNPYTPLSFSPEMSQAQSNAGTNTSASQQTNATALLSRGLCIKQVSCAQQILAMMDFGTQVPQTYSPFSHANVPSTPNAADVADTMKSFNPVSPFPFGGANGTFSGPASQPGGQTNQGTQALTTNGSYPGQGATTTMKLTQSFKVIQVPVAGQPGQFVTGFLPVLPQEQGDASSSPSSALPPSNLEPLLSGTPLRAMNKLRKNVKVVVLCAAAFLILLTSQCVLAVAHAYEYNTASSSDRDAKYNSYCWCAGYRDNAGKYHFK